MMRIAKPVQVSKMTQQQAAKTLGISQPRLNALLKGKIADFSLDALVNMPARAGMQVKNDRRESRSGIERNRAPGSIDIIPGLLDGSGSPRIDVRARRDGT